VYQNKVARSRNWSLVVGAWRLLQTRFSSSTLLQYSITFLVLVLVLFLYYTRCLSNVFPERVVGAFFYLEFRATMSVGAGAQIGIEWGGVLLMNE
jgi:hypothetical protein